MKKDKPTKKRRIRGDKFREMIIYISELSEDDSTFGVTKLNKLLFYSDFIHFAQHGSSISGEGYQKLPHGPAPRRLLPKLREMQSRFEIVIRERAHFTLTQKKPIVLRAADLDLFTPQEVDVMCSVVDEFQELNAKQISIYSHKFLGWELAEEGETIPYEVSLLGDRDPTNGEIKYAKSLRNLAKRAIAKG